MRAALVMSLAAGMFRPLPPALAEEPAVEARAELVASSITPHTELKLFDAAGRWTTGKFVRLGADERTLVVRRFVPGVSRFETREVFLDDVAELRIVKRDSNDLYPLLGMLGLGGAGAAIGYFGSKPGSRDVGTVVLAFFGTTGGFLLGAILAPGHRTEVVVWP